MPRSATLACHTTSSLSVLARPGTFFTSRATDPIFPHSRRPEGPRNYWDGLATSGGELYQRPGLAVPVFATNDGLTLVGVLAPVDELADFRRGGQTRFLRALDACGDLGERARAAVRVERVRFAPDLPQEFRVPHGPGWVLVGDAGLVLDPISAAGITHAFRDAERLAAAVLAAHGAGRPLDAGLAAAHRARDADTGPMARLTARLTAELVRRRPLPLGQRLLLSSLVDRPQEIDRFLAVLAGVEPADRYLSAGNAVRLIAGRWRRQPAHASRPALG